MSDFDNEAAEAWAWQDSGNDGPPPNPLADDPDAVYDDRDEPSVVERDRLDRWTREIAEKYAKAQEERLLRQSERKAVP